MPPRQEAPTNDLDNGTELLRVSSEANKELQVQIKRSFRSQLGGLAFERPAASAINVAVWLSASRSVNP